MQITLNGSGAMSFYTSNLLFFVRSHLIPNTAITTRAENLAASHHYPPHMHSGSSAQLRPVEEQLGQPQTFGRVLGWQPVPSALDRADDEPLEEELFHLGELLRLHIAGVAAGGEERLERQRKQHPWKVTMRKLFLCLATCSKTVKEIRQGKK